MATLEEAITEVKRELNLRARVYPRWIAKGSMTQAEADQHNERLQKALDELEKVRDARQPGLFDT